MNKPTEKEIQKAIEWFSLRSSPQIYMDGSVHSMLNISVTPEIINTIEYALEQTLEDYTLKEPCEFCAQRQIDFDNDTGFHIMNGMIWCVNNERTYRKTKINYCPICGRKIGE